MGRGPRDQGEDRDGCEVRGADVGSKSAIHIRSALGAGSSFPLQIGQRRVLDVQSSVMGSGACIARRHDALAPGYGDAYANFYVWSAASATQRGCAAGGSVLLELVPQTGRDQVRLTVNLQFADGTTWIDRVFLVDAPL